MTTKKISSFPVASSVLPTDVGIGNVGGQTQQIPLSVQLSFMEANISNLGNVSGNFSGIHTGDGSGLTGITGATGGISNTVNTNIVADSDNNGSGLIDFSIGPNTAMQVLNNGNISIINDLVVDNRIGINTSIIGQNQTTPLDGVVLDVFGDIMLPELSSTPTDKRELAFYRRGNTSLGTPIDTGFNMGAISWYGSTNDGDNAALAVQIYATPSSGSWITGASRKADLHFKVGTGASITAMTMKNNGGILLPALLSAAASTDVNINGSNELHSVTSSRFYKTNETDPTIDLSKYKDIRVCQYDFKEEFGGGHEHGSIAEEFELIFPQFVYKKERGGEMKPDSIQYSRVGGVLNVLKIQELERRIDQLET